MAQVYTGIFPGLAPSTESKAPNSIKNESTNFLGDSQNDQLGGDQFGKGIPKMTG